MRVRVPSAKGNPKALEEIKRSLTSLTGVHEVTVNAATGSIVVNYDPKRHADFHKHLSGGGEHKKAVEMADPPKLSEIDEVEEMLEKEAEYLSKHSHSAKAVVDFIRRCDVGLKRITGNQLDLKVLTPMALAVYAFLELGFEAASPVWLTLGLFSFNHFVDLHSHHEPEAAAPPRRRPVRPV